MIPTSPALTVRAHRDRSRSDQLFAEALRFIPGGVNSPVRAFRAVGGNPLFVNRASGARVWDVDGHEYLDYVGTWGPAIHGHAYPPIVRAVQEAATHGTSFGIPNPFEVDLARLICEAVPSVEKIRFTSSGTEACMTAIRLARGFTGRDVLVKFAGCYHGHADALLVKAGSGALTFGHPDSAGIPPEVARNTRVLPFNDAGALRQLFSDAGREIAGVIVEPVPANAGLYPPGPGYLELLREITRAHDTVLIFDEVMTGFRLGWAGAQGCFGIQPDVSCFGKIIGGGLPVGAVGGRAEIMDCLAPVGPVYQAGTLSGNPLAMAAGLAALEGLRDGRVYRQLEERGAALELGLRAAGVRADIPLQVQRVGSLFCAYFTHQPVANLDDALTSDRARFAGYFHALLERGLYLPPSQFEACFLSSAHTEEDLETTLREATDALAAL